MTSYEKLRAKVDIYERLLSYITDELRDLKDKPEEYLPDSVTLPTLDKEAIRDCCRLILSEIYEKEQALWRLK